MKKFILSSLTKFEISLFTLPLIFGTLVQLGLIFIASLFLVVFFDYVLTDSESLLLGIFTPVLHYPALIALFFPYSLRSYPKIQSNLRTPLIISVLIIPLTGISPRMLVPYPYDFGLSFIFEFLIIHFILKTKFKNFQFQFNRKFIWYSMLLGSLSLYAAIIPQWIIDFPYGMIIGIPSMFLVQIFFIKRWLVRWDSFFKNNSISF